MEAPDTKSEGNDVILVVYGVEGFNLFHGGAPPTADRTKILVEEVDLPFAASDERG